MADRADTPAIERRIVFAREDLELFADASGDRNPLHIDSAFARRSAFGGCVVQGALVSLAMLGVLPVRELAEIRSIRARFAGPVLPDALLTVAARRHGERSGEWELSLSGRGKVLARILARPGGDAAGTATPALGGGVQADADARPMLADPANVPFAELAEGHAILGSYRSEPALATVAARTGAQALDPALLEGLAWASYVVGMELPGRDGLFAGITLAAAAAERAADEPAQRQSIRVRDRDERTGMLVLEGALFARSGATVCTALIECFALGSTAPPDARALGISAAAGGPARGAVVVIGGSRGFGASLALALLAGGHVVHVVFSTASDSADELSRAAGPLAHRLFRHRIDARDPAALEPLRDQLTVGAGQLHGLVLNAAPPPLAMGVTGESGAELAEYVAESLLLTAVPLGALLPALDANGGWVLFCSSAALTAPPRDWPHYVAAKGALEGLARWLAAAEPGLRTVVIRPPKMPTDLTRTPSGRIGATATETVATWVATRLADGELAPGLSVLEPDRADLEPAAASR